MRLLRGSWARPILALAVAVAAVLVVFGGIAGSRTPEVQAQVPEQMPAIPEQCQSQVLWNICVIKFADPSDTGASFDFELTHGDFTDTFSRGHEGVYHEGLDAFEIEERGDIVTIREVDLPDGWELVNIWCVLSGIDPSINLDFEVIENGVEIELDNPGGPSATVFCGFWNELDEDALATPTPPGDRRPPNIGTGLSGLFGSGPAPATPTAVARPAAVAPAQVISPPRTGDGGLR